MKQQFSTFVLLGVLFLQLSTQGDSKLLENLEKTKYTIKSRILDSQSQKLLNLKIQNKTFLNSLTINKFESGLLHGKTEIKTTEFHFDRTYDDLIIQFGHKSVMWMLSKANNQNQMFISHDSGISFSKYDVSANISTKTIHIDEFFINPANKEHVIFLDKTNKILSISNDNGKSLALVNIPFQPEMFYFINNQKIVLASEKLNEKKNLWISLDTGKSWKLISENFIQIAEWQPKSGDSVDNFYFIEKNLANTMSQLISIDLKNFKMDDQKKSNNYKTILMQNAIEIVNVQGYLFALKQAEKEVVLQISIDKTNFEYAIFKAEQTPSKVVDFTVVSATDDGIYIAITHLTENHKKTDLFHSKGSNILKFELTLNDIINNCENHHHEEFSNKPTLNSNAVYNCIEVSKLNEIEDGNSYIANAKNQANRIETLIKRSDKWEPIDFFESSDKNSSLNLIGDFYQTTAEPYLMTARVNKPALNTNAITEVGVYVSQDQGTDWYKILGSNYIYSLIMDHGEPVLVAVVKDKPTNKIIYSKDYGNSWNEYYFVDQLAYVNEIISESSGVSSAFYLSCTHAKNSNSLIKIDFDSESHKEDVSQTKFKPVITEILIPQKQEHKIETTKKTAKKTTPTPHLASIESKPVKAMKFSIAIPEEIKPNSFKVSFFLDLENQFRLNNYFLRIVSSNQQTLKNEHRRFKILDSSIFDFKNFEITSEQSIKTSENTFEIVNLKPSTEYTVYFYANVTNNGNPTILLNKKLIVLTENDDITEENLNRVFVLVSVMMLFVSSVIFFLWIWSKYKKSLLIEYTQFVGNRTIVKRDDKQFLIEKDSDGSTVNIANTIYSV